MSILLVGVFVFILAISMWNTKLIFMYKQKTKVLDDFRVSEPTTTIITTKRGLCL